MTHAAWSFYPNNGLYIEICPGSREYLPDMALLAARTRELQHGQPLAARVDDYVYDEAELQRRLDAHGAWSYLALDTDEGDQLVGFAIGHTAVTLGADQPVRALDCCSVLVIEPMHDTTVITLLLGAVTGHASRSPSLDQAEAGLPTLPDDIRLAE